MIKKISLYLFVSVFFFAAIVGCQDPEETTTQAPEPLPQLTQQPVKKVSELDGTYFFDTEKYRNEQLKQANSPFKEMKSEDIDKVIQVFRPFRIDVEGNKATASFANDVIQGELKTLKEGAGETRLFMTPSDADKKSDSVTIIINGQDLVLDPGKKESDKMFFKKCTDC